MNSFLKFFFHVVFSSLLLSSCGAGEDGNSSATGTYRFQLLFPESVPRLDQSSPSLSNIDCAAAKIATIDFTFSIQGTPHGIHRFACSDHKATINKVSTDVDRVDAYAKNAVGNPLLYGYAETFIQAGRESSGRITLSYMDSNNNEVPASEGEDGDGDGFDLAKDCDDTNGEIYPGARETPGNGIDENCDGLDAAVWYQDADGDGFGDLTTTHAGAAPPEGYVALGTDCDDTDSAIHPDADEIPANSVDENCDGVAEDQDGDGFLRPDDCDDTDSMIYPGAAEIRDNGIDEDCDGEDLETSLPVRSFRIANLDMTFVRIPGGTFTMGSPPDEPGRAVQGEAINDYEVQHEVTLTQDFYMQTTEVTQQQWETVVNAVPGSQLDSVPSDFYLCGRNCPVENVSWDNVRLFIDALNGLYPNLYACRLPMEAEWEYAARGGSREAFAGGPLHSEPEGCVFDPILDEYGWYCFNSGGAPHPVQQKRANAYGLFDMHGNVYEWCQDVWGPYPTEPVVDPEGPNDNSSHVLRGGDYFNGAAGCRSAHRNLLTPGFRYGSYGFRLVCESLSR